MAAAAGREETKQRKKTAEKTESNSGCQSKWKSQSKQNETESREEGGVGCGEKCTFSMCAKC